MTAYWRLVPISVFWRFVFSSFSSPIPFVAPKFSLTSRPACPVSCGFGAREAVIDSAHVLVVSRHTIPFPVLISAYEPADIVVLRYRIVTVIVAADREKNSLSFLQTKIAIQAVNSFPRTKKNFSLPQSSIAIAWPTPLPLYLFHFSSASCPFSLPFSSFLPQRTGVST